MCSPPAAELTRATASRRTCRGRPPPSLAEIASTSPGDLMAPERFATIAQRLVLRDIGDYLVITDGPVCSLDRRRCRPRAANNA